MSSNPLSMATANVQTLIARSATSDMRPDTSKPRPNGGDMELECYACSATFCDDAALRNHKIEMRDREFANDEKLIHVFCHYCDQDFVTERAGRTHWDQFHAEKQNINCPGCDKHFVQFSAFVHHVEFHECPVIFQETIAARCQKELEFARALERIDRKSRGEIRTKDFSVYLNSNRENFPTNHLPARPAITSGPSAPWPAETEVPGKSDFPRLPTREYHHGNNDTPDLLTGEETNALHGKEGENPWAFSQPHVDDASPAQKPTQKQMMQLQLFNNQETESDWQREEKAMTRARGLVRADPDDPRGDNFDPQRLLCPYTKLYKCPRCRKGKGFKNWPALQQHMKSATHAFTKTVACPGCKDNFKHLFALAAHVESADKKCTLKHDDVFEIFLGQLTWNLVEVVGVHKSDGTMKFGISKKAEQEYKPAPPQLTFGHQQSRISDRPRLTTKALSQLEKQADKPLPHFNTQEHQSQALRQPSAYEKQFPPLQLGQQPQQACTQARSFQNQPQVQPQRSQAQDHYQQQFPSLQQRQQPRISPVQTQARLQSQTQPHQQQPPQQLTRNQRQSSTQQQPARSLGSGLTELAVAHIPAFRSEHSVNSEEAWSNDGDGDAGW